jgi:hypothetical protein
LRAARLISSQNRSWSRAMTDAPVQTTTNQPFFSPSGEAFMPNAIANGPWDPKSMHGRVVIGLLAHAIGQRHGGEDLCRHD